MGRRAGQPLDCRYGMPDYEDCPLDDPSTGIVIAEEHVSHALPVGFMARGICKPEWVVENVSGSIPTLRVRKIGNDVIRLDEPPKLRVVVSRVVIVKPGGGVED